MDYETYHAEQIETLSKINGEFLRKKLKLAKLDSVKWIFLEVDDVDDCEVQIFTFNCYSDLAWYLQWKVPAKVLLLGEEVEFIYEFSGGYLEMFDKYPVDSEKFTDYMLDLF